MCVVNLFLADSRTWCQLLTLVHLYGRTVTYTFKSFGGYSSRTFWRGSSIHFGGVFSPPPSNPFKVAITAERAKSKSARRCHLSRDCTRLYAMIDKDCGSREKHRVVTWAGGVVVSTVQKETVFVEAWSMSVAFSCPAAGLVC